MRDRMRNNWCEMMCLCVCLNGSIFTLTRQFREDSNTFNIAECQIQTFVVYVSVICRTSGEVVYDPDSSMSLINTCNIDAYLIRVHVHMCVVFIEIV